MSGTCKDAKTSLEQYKNRIIYSLPVRSGEWTNELALLEQREFLYNHKKDHCQLLVQKTRKMFRNLLRPTVLVPESAYICSGLNYQLKSYGITNVAACGRENRVELYLSGVITEREIDSTQHFTHGCILTASPNKTPCVRNTFRIEDCDGRQRAGPLNYGEDVYIQACGGAGPPLYIQCENSTIDTFGAHLRPRLSCSPDIYCRFKIIHWNPDLRFETSNTFIHQSSHVIIQHTASGLNLAVEFNNRIPTFFGPEYTVSCHTFRNTLRLETSENIWKIAGFEKGQPGP